MHTLTKVCTRKGTRRPTADGFAPPTSSPLIAILEELPHNQLDEKVDIEPHALLEDVPVPDVVVLRFQDAVQRDATARSRDRDGTRTPLQTELAYFVAGDGEIDLVPLALVVGRPAHENASVGQILG